MKTWHVTAKKPTGSFRQYWIEEPGFRIHKVVSDSYTIDSTFDIDGLAIPTSVIVKGIDREFHREYHLTNVQVATGISSDRFEPAGMRLALKTPINDYRIHRIVGYWNGNTIAERSVTSGTVVPSGEELIPPEQQSGFWPFFLIAIAVFDLAFVLRKKQLG